MDLLSRLLTLTPVDGRLDLRCHLGAPWRFEQSAAKPGEIPFHVVLSGEAIVEGAGQPPLAVAAGDVVLFPGGAGHAMHDGSGRRPKPLKQTAGEFIRIVENAGKGAVADILCGQFLLAPSSRRLMQTLLPGRLVVRTMRSPAPGDDMGSTHLARLIGLLREEATEQGAGSQMLVRHYSAALFALSLRFASVAEEAPPGLLRLARWPRLQPAVLAMFSSPGRPWTLPDLAAQCNLSRATLIRQFQEALGRSPAEMLVEIRMAAAAQALTDGTQSVAAIGESVGYFSEAAFQRAFKKAMGETPARWRSASVAAASETKEHVDETSGG